MSYQRAWISRDNTFWGPICRDPICHTQIFQGPHLPGPNLPPRGPICRGPICHQQNFRGPICRDKISKGPNLPPRGPICRGPICRGPICRQGAQSAGARFAKKWQIGPQKVRGPICRQIGEGPNLPGPNLPGPKLPRTGWITLYSTNCLQQSAAGTEDRPIFRRGLRFIVQDTSQG